MLCSIQSFVTQACNDALRPVANLRQASAACGRDFVRIHEPLPMAARSFNHFETAISAGNFAWSEPLCHRNIGVVKSAKRYGHEPRRKGQLEELGDVCAKRLDVRAHGDLGLVRVAPADGGENRVVLLMHAFVLRRRVERNEPEPKRTFVQAPQQLGKTSFLPDRAMSK